MIKEGDGPEHGHMIFRNNYIVKPKPGDKPLGIHIPKPTPEEEEHQRWFNALSPEEQDEHVRHHS